MTIELIQKKLGLPEITFIVKPYEFGDLEIYFNKEKIGKVSPHVLNKEHSDINEFNNINWVPIYEAYKSEINKLIVDEFADKIRIVLGAYRRLYVQDESGNILKIIEVI